MKAETERRLLAKIAKKASARAQRISRVLGLTIMVMVDNVVYEKYPDGTMKEIDRITETKPNFSLKKGTVLCLKRKD